MDAVARRETGTQSIHTLTGKKINDQLCGRLIIWDADALLNDIVVPATDYCHPQHALSSQVGQNCFLSLPSIPQEKSQSVAMATRKASERLALIEAAYGTIFGRKPMLH